MYGTERYPVEIPNWRKIFDTKYSVKNQIKKKIRWKMFKINFYIFQTWFWIYGLLDYYQARIGLKGFALTIQMYEI